MDNPFLRSLFVRPPIIAGRTLLPFSAYHAAALMLLDSPIICGGGVAPQDLVTAIWVCSHDSVTGPPSLFPKPPHNDIVKVATALMWESDWAVFEIYIGDYLEFPELWHPEDKGESRKSGIPWPFYAVSAVLMHMHGISRREAWDMPLSELVAYKAAIAESNGAEVQSEKERQLDMLATCLGKAASGEPMTAEEQEWWLRYQAAKAEQAKAPEAGKE